MQLPVVTSYDHLGPAFQHNGGCKDLVTALVSLGQQRVKMIMKCATSLDLSVAAAERLWQIFGFSALRQHLAFVHLTSQAAQPLLHA